MGGKGSKGHPRHPEKRLWPRLSGGPDDCWLWPGKLTRSGYGRMRFRGRDHPTHRVAYMLTKGAIPVGMMVLHHCDVRPCCNPRHLYVGTARDNIRDAFRRGRARPRGRDVGPMEV